MARNRRKRAAPVSKPAAAATRGRTAAAAPAVNTRAVAAAAGHARGVAGSQGPTRRAAAAAAIQAASASDAAPPQTRARTRQQKKQLEDDPPALGQPAQQQLHGKEAPEQAKADDTTAAAKAPTAEQAAPTAAKAPTAPSGSGSAAAGRRSKDKARPATPTAPAPAAAAASVAPVVVAAGLNTSSSSKQAGILQPPAAPAPPGAAEGATTAAASDAGDTAADVDAADAAGDPAGAMAGALDGVAVDLGAGAVTSELELTEKVLRARTRELRWALLQSWANCLQDGVVAHHSYQRVLQLLSQLGATTGLHAPGGSADSSNCMRQQIAAEQAAPSPWAEAGRKALTGAKGQLQQVLKQGVMALQKEALPAGRGTRHTKQTAADETCPIKQLLDILQPQARKTSGLPRHADAATKLYDLRHSLLPFQETPDADLAAAGLAAPQLSTSSMQQLAMLLADAAGLPLFQRCALAMCTTQPLLDPTKPLLHERVLLGRHTNRAGEGPLLELHPFPCAASPTPVREGSVQPYHEHAIHYQLPRWLVQLQSGPEAAAGLLGLVAERRRCKGLGQPLGVCWSRVDVARSQQPVDKGAAGQEGKGRQGKLAKMTKLPAGGISVWVLELVMEHRS